MLRPPGTRGTAAHLATRPPFDQVRFYSGYAAWPISRLEHEVAQGKWRVALPSQQLLADGLASGGLRQLLEAQLR